MNTRSMHAIDFNLNAIPADAPAAARTCLKLLSRLKHGVLHVQLPDGTMHRFGSADSAHKGEAGHAHELPVVGHIRLDNWNVCSAALKSGDIGFAESYIAGDWHTPNLAHLLRVFIANRREVEDVIYGTWLGRLAYRIKHLLNRNTKQNSQKNIHAHYDLGNAFYELWLDDTMSYSSAWFEGDMAKPMREAQWAKVRRALRMTDVKPHDRVLEIGCGWGGLAEIAATEFDANITGVTLSTEQLAFAQQRMDKLGKLMSSDAGPSQVARAPREGSGDATAQSVGARFFLQDYRDISDQPFDAICSIEMVEAVGREYWPTYFESVSRLLKSGGKACIQAIVIDDALFDRYIKSTDFIQQYIFPGGCLPCPREFKCEAEKAGLQVVDEFAFGKDYAETCRRWRADFLARREQIMPLGFDERFMRTWEFYLAYCEAAFDEDNISVVQYTLRKP